MTALTILMILTAYLLGSISSAVLICKLWGLPDPRKEGSGNPGATNVYRVGGKIPALLTLWFDVLKGMVPVWGSYFLGIEPFFLGLIAVAACLGHIFPLYFQFRGGKAVATALGRHVPGRLGNGVTADCDVACSLQNKQSVITCRAYHCLSGAFLCVLDKAAVHRAGYYDFAVNFVATSIKYRAPDIRPGKRL